MCKVEKEEWNWEKNRETEHSEKKNEQENRKR